MANLTPSAPPQEVHVGDSGRPISYLFKDATGITFRNLSGYAAWITFWYPDAAPHVVWAAKVAGAVTTYVLRGVEFTIVGDLLAQFTVMDTATGIRTSSEIFRFKVMRKPT